MASAGAGGQRSSGRSNQRSASGTQFPSEFLSQFGQIFGRPVSLQELLGGLPGTQGLFGGPPVGVYGLQQPGFGQPFQGQSPAGGQAVQGPFLSDYFPGQQGGGGAQPGQRPSGFNATQVSEVINSRFEGPPAERSHMQARLQEGIQKLGLDPNNMSQEDIVRAMTFPGAGLNAGMRSFVEGSLPGILASIAQQAEPQQRFGTQGATLGGFNPMAGLQNLGFGQPPPEAQQQQIRQLPGIQAPQGEAAQAQIAPEGFEQFQQDLFQSQFAPVRQEIERQGQIQDRQLQAQLAQAGIASSGTGIGQLRSQVQERNVQLADAAENAANRASTERFGLEYQQQLANAQLRQDMILQNMGFDLNTQLANADNILKGDMARADNYLKTFGLNTAAAEAMRDDFLGALGIAEADLQRMDQYSVQVLGLLLNNWLQQASVVAGAGQFSTGVSSGRNTAFGWNMSGAYGGKSGN